VLLPASAFAQALEREEPAQVMTRFAAEIEEATARLDLTESQETLALPIIERGLAKGWALAQSHGLSSGSRPSMQQLLSLQGDAQQIQREMEQDLGRVLTKDQMTEYTKIRREWQEKAMAAVRARMGGG